MHADGDGLSWLIASNSSFAAKQRLLVDVADGEAVAPVVDQGEVLPAVGEEHAAARGVRHAPARDSQPLTRSGLSAPR